MLHIIITDSDGTTVLDTDFISLVCGIVIDEETAQCIRQHEGAVIHALTAAKAAEASAEACRNSVAKMVAEKYEEQKEKEKENV